jgi:hypothetical protein
MESQPLLFGPEPEVRAEAHPTWKEVPQARFLSWSPERQLLYCALRDEDSAVVDSDHAEFYLQRARSYREMSCQAK